MFDELIEGLQILCQYATESIRADCDRIFFYNREDITLDNYKEGDVKRLEALGFEWDERFECWEYIN